MHPILYSIGNFTIPSYGLVYLSAFLSATAVFAWLSSPRARLPFGRMFEIGFQTAIAGEVGARLTFVIVEWDRFRAGAFTFKQFLVSGRVVLGGVLAGVAFCAWLVRRHRFPVLAVLDSLMVAVALGMAIGRFGCLLAGCCYGKPTGSAWGIVFTDPMAARISGTPLHVALQPTQLLQAVTGLALFGLLLWLHHHRRFDGQVLAAFLLLGGALRFFTELLRGDPRGEAYGLATSQWIGLAMALIGAAWLLWRPVATLMLHHHRTHPLANR